MVDLHKLIEETNRALKDCCKIIDNAERLKRLEFTAERLAEKDWAPEDIDTVVNGVKWILKEPPDRLHPVRQPWKR